MASKKEKTKEERIQTERRRLIRIYKDLDSKKRLTVEGIIDRAAHMRVTLEDWADYLDENGFVEPFQQGEQAPYERKRPTADLYNTMNTAYQKAIKQLTDLLPKDVPPPRDEDDFDDFVKDR